MSIFGGSVKKNISYWGKVKKIVFGGKVKKISVNGGKLKTSRLLVGR